jgi:hypothetical protein
MHMGLEVHNIRRYFQLLKGLLIEDKLAIYAFFGFLIPNIGFYYLYRLFAPLFNISTQIFSIRIIGLNEYPLWGYVFVLLATLLSALFVLLSIKVSSWTSGVLLIALGTVLCFLVIGMVMPLSITLAVAYGGLAGVISGVRIIDPSKETFPSNSDKTQHQLFYELTHQRFTTLLSYSVWATITIVVAGLSALLLNPAIRIMAEIGGSSWVFAELQSIIAFFLIFYYAIGFLSMVTLQAYRKLKEIEKAAY